jgi:hypothetical protein
MKRKHYRTYSANQKQIVIEGLKEALYITNIGYPYYGVPTKIRRAIKYLTKKS